MEDSVDPNRQDRAQAACASGGFNVVFIIVVHIIYIKKASNPTKTMQWDSKESKSPVLRQLIWIQVWPELGRTGRTGHSKTCIGGAGGE